MGSWEDAQEGLQAAFDMGAEVTSNSWGGDCDNDGVMTGELAETLSDAGMLSVFAAGNGGASGVDCPGAADKVTTVGSVDLNENIAGSSGRGPCNWGGVTRTCPDVVAVGVSVVAAGHGCDTCYATKSGTSMATPHVAGVVALLQQARKAQLGMGLSAPDKEADVLLHATAKDLGTAGADNAYGWGLAQGKAAYDRMVSGPALQLVHDFHIALPEMRARHSNDLGFTLTNLGSVTVQGRLVHRAVQQDTGSCPPACEAVTITDADVTLGRLAERASTIAFRGADHAAGTWRVTASFAYTYTDPADGQGKPGLIEAGGSFVLRKVAWAVGRALPATTTTGTLLLSGLTLANVGNDDARQLVLEESFDAKGHLPAPIAPPGPGLLGVLADPPPDHLSHAQPTTVLYFWDEVGTIAQGTAWHTRYNFLAAHPGTFVFHAVLAYEDGAGDAYGQSFDQVSAVTLL